jgi:beta-N-acetylhexosaminidase
VRRGEVGGVILFGGNVVSETQVKALVRRLQAAARAGGNPPLLVMADQEGGSVRRLPEAPPRDSAEAMGRWDPASTEREGRRTGLALRRLGIAVDLAPVADVPDSPRTFLGDRAFGRDPALAARHAAAFAAGLRSACVAATAKHFPGLGTARASTDRALVRIRTGRAELERRLLPFERLVEEGAELVMVSSASYPALDRSGAPALFSRAIVTGLLRGRLGFGGVVITDALEAPAPSLRPGAAAAAVEAGVDLLLYTSEATSAAGYRRLLEAARATPSLRRRLEESYRRLATLKRRLG